MSNPDKAAKVAVVGGGISGLVATKELLAAGYDVRLFESGERCGGVLGSDNIGGFVVERAASSFVPAPFGAVELAHELGVPLQEAAAEARKRWVYIDGALQEVPMGPRQLLSSPLLSWRGKFRALAEPLQPPNPGADESIASFCRRRLGDEVTRALIAPFVTGVFGGDAEKLSLRACFPSLAALEGRGGIARGVAATKIEAAFSRIQGGASAKKGRRIMAPVGGMSTLVTALEKMLQGRISYSTAIASWEKKTGKVLLRDANGGEFPADTIVFATPAYVTASLLAPHNAQMAAILQSIPYAGMAVVGLGFSGAVEHPMDGFGLLVAKDEAVRTLGVVFESTVWPDRARTGGTLVRCMMGGARDPDLFHLSDEEIVACARDDLKTTLGITSVPSMQNVVRWPRGIPQYLIDHLDKIQEAEAMAESLGVVLAGNAFRGVSVNDCVAKAKKVVEAVAQRLATKQLALLLILWGAIGAMACGGTSKTSVIVADGGDAGTVIAENIESTALAPELPKGRGKVEVTARWLWPPAVTRRSPGRNHCGVARASDLKVELMGGLSNTAVLGMSGPHPGDAHWFVSDCKVIPRVVVGGVGKTLLIQNRETRGHDLVIERLGDGGEVVATVGRLPMRVAGQTFALPLREAGILRVHSTSDPEDYSYAISAVGTAAVTGDNGRAELQFGAGPAELRLWHPPLRGQKLGLQAALTVQVQDQVLHKHTVDLRPKAL